jgi:hypothetical protein
MILFTINHYFKVLSTASLTLLSYSPLFYWNICAATLLAGESGFGSHRRDRIDVKIAQTSYTGLH